MLRDELMLYLDTKPESIRDYPFGPEPLVMKVEGKMFALLTRHQNRDALNLKCDPLQAQQLRDVWQDVIPGYHMNKRHWNTVFIEGDVPVPEIERMIDHSYALVVRGLRKVDRLRLATGYGAQALYRGD